MDIHYVGHRQDCEQNTFCGPAAISALTGYSAELVAAVTSFNRLDCGLGRKQRKVRSMYPSEIARCFWLLGFAVVAECRTRQPRRLAEFASRELANMLVLVPGHYVAVVDGLVVDNKEPAGVPLFKSRHARRYVDYYCTVQPTPNTCSIPEEQLWETFQSRTKKLRWDLGLKLRPVSLQHT